MYLLIVIGSLLLSVVAGGFFVTSLHRANKTQLIKILLAFSGGFLLSIAFNHFIPELYHEGKQGIGMYILLGFLIQLLLEFFSGGIEHGHVHVHKGQRMPWGLFLSLSVHSVLEGIPLGNEIAMSASAHAHEHGHSLLLGILFHQMPVSIALMTLLIHSNLNLKQSWLILLLFGIMTPLGVVFGSVSPQNSALLNPQIILAIVVGMFLHISTTIIFETSENHRVNLMKLSAVIAGIGLALLVN